MTPDYYLYVQSAASKSAYESTCLLMVIKNGIPKPVGSGVFVEVDNNFFLFTAAHVIESKESEMVVGLNESEYQPLGGEIIKNELKPNQKRDSDRNDVAIIKLDIKTVEKLRVSFKFVPKFELGINHNDELNKRYVALGFPESKQKFNPYKREFHSKPFAYSTGSADLSTYNKIGLVKHLNHIVRFKRKHVQNHKTKKIITSPNPYGMSGCGLWHIPVQVLDPAQHIRKSLVSILTEWPVKHKEFLIGTRIDLFTEIIRKYYNLDLQVSEIVTIEL